MEVPQVDYNKRNLRWMDRICRENRVIASNRSTSFDPHSNSGSLQGKINNLPSPYEYCKKVAEYISRVSEPTGLHIPEVCSPRGKFFIPQVRFTRYIYECV